MADNVSITQGTGTSIAADDIGGVLHQRVKISQGADGSATDVSSAAPLQVTLANTGANSTAVKVDGSAATQPVSAASLPLPALAATSTKQSDGSQKTQIVDGSGNVIGATSNALDVNIKSGSSAGTEYTEDAAAAANPSGPMSMARRKDTLSSSEVSADGDNIALNATSKGELCVKHNDPENLGIVAEVTGTGGALNDTPIAATNVSNYRFVSVHFTGTFSGQVTFESSNDNSNWTTTGLLDQAVTSGAVSNTVTMSGAINGIYAGNLAAKYFRVRVSSYTSGTISATAEFFASQTSPKVIGLAGVTQSGTWNIGTLSTITNVVHVDDNSSTLSVDDGGGNLSIDDGGNSITIDAPVGTPAFVRLSDGSSAISTLPVSLATVPSHAVTNAGTFAVQESGSALTALQLIDDTVFTDDAAFTPGTSKVNVIGLEADESSTDSIDEGDVGAARMTLDRKQIVTVQPHTQGGLSVFNATSSDGATALTNSAQAIKASAGQVYGWYIYNPNATAQFVQFYNTAAASVTVGTTNPLFMLTIPATAGANVNFAQGIEFTNAGFSVAATSTAGGNGAPGTALDCVIFYK